MKKSILMAVMLGVAQCISLNAFAAVASGCMGCKKSECSDWSYVYDCCLNCQAIVGPVVPSLNCTTNSDCYGDSVPVAEWYPIVTEGDNGAGGEYKEVIKCIDSKCTESKDYRCSSGYYGRVGEDFFGCVRCPSDGKSRAGMNTDITDCYITEFSDDTGSGVYTGNCYYSVIESGGDIGGFEPMLP